MGKGPRGRRERGKEKASAGGGGASEGAKVASSSTGSDLRVLAGVGALVALVTAGALAAVAIPTPHPGGDNAGYLALAHSLVQGTGYTELWDPGAPPHTKYPPVLALVLAGLMVLGVETWFTFKLVVAACAVSLAVLLTYVWAAGHRGAAFAGALAGLVLLSSGWLEASRWILSEPLFLVFTLGSVVAASGGWGGSGGRS